METSRLFVDILESAIRHGRRNQIQTKGADVIRVHQRHYAVTANHHTLSRVLGLVKSSFGLKFYEF
jgi:predicted transcriptional regulator